MAQFFEDLECYQEGILAQGFWALQFHRFGSLRTRFRSPLVRKPWGILHQALVKISEIAFGISIGRNVPIGRRLIIEHFGNIIIHNDCQIGDDVTIRQGVTLGNRRLDRPLDAPIIGSRVNIGAGAKILGRVTIGDDVDIGANAVVLCDVPSNSIAVGVPARVMPRKAAQAAPTPPAAAFPGFAPSPAGSGEPGEVTPVPAGDRHVGEGVAR